jgi:ligand-binding SRPBCC domain-containing protein
MYHISNTQWVDVPIDKVWDFFSQPKNLLKITPPEMNMKVVEESERALYAGMIIRYQVSPILGIPLSWTSAITAVKEGSYFIDEMLEGPFKVWHHQHLFEEKDGGTNIIDELHYRVPLEPLGKLFHGLLVKNQLKNMFAHREQVTKNLFQ